MTMLVAKRLRFRFFKQALIFDRVIDKKESDATAPLPHKSHTALVSLRYPILRMSKVITIISKSFAVIYLQPQIYFCL